MEARKWEDLPMDCLVNVLGRVGVDSLLVNVPFVCKPWYQATLDRHCWKQLFFPYTWRCSLKPFVDSLKNQFQLQGELCETKFVKGLVDRSRGCATVVDLPVCYTEEALTYVADKCPDLNKLGIHSRESSTMLALSVVIGKFKKLESLVIESDLEFEDIVTEIGKNCENFVALSLVAAIKAKIGEDEVAAITCLPKIKHLTLMNAFIKRKNLIKILKCCVELVHLDIRNCWGFYEVDKNLLKLASHIPTFKWYRDDYSCDSDDSGFYYGSETDDSEYDSELDNYYDNDF